MILLRAQDLEERDVSSTLVTNFKGLETSGLESLVPGVPASFDRACSGFWRVRDGRDLWDD